MAENTEELEPLVTRCPECSTRFRVTEVQLQAAGGRVRCGSCLSVFFGTDHLQWDLEPAVVATDPVETLDRLLQEIDVFEATEDAAAAVSGAGHATDPLEPPVQLGGDGALARTDPAADEAGDRADLTATVEPAVIHGIDPERSVPWMDPDDAARATTALATSDDPADSGVGPLPTHGGAGLGETGGTVLLEGLDPLEGLEPLEGLDPGDTAAPAGAAAGSPVDPEAADAGFDIPVAAPEAYPPEPALSGLSLSDTSLSERSPAASSRSEPALSGPVRPGTAQPATPPEDRFVRLWDDLPTGVDVFPEPAPEPDPVAVLPGVASVETGATPDPGVEGLPAHALPTAGLPAASPVVLSPADLLLESPPPPRRRYWRVLAATTGLLLVGAQVVWYFLPGWAADPAMRWLPERVCAVAGCRLEPLRALDQLLLTDVILRGHPEQPELRLVNLLIVNTAPFDQAFPDVEIAFRAPTGDLVAWKRFAPAEYLAGELVGSTTIPAKTPVRIELQLQDPGTQAYGYEISLK